MFDKLDFALGEAFGYGWLLDRAFQFVVWGLGVLGLVVLLFGPGCSAPESRDFTLKVVQRGHFEFEASHCRVYEVLEMFSETSYSILQRFNVCDPPIPGMSAGSKPAGTTKETNAP